MILGAGVYQLPAIRRAREMGIETVVLSIPGNYPGIREASRFHPVDTTDIHACLDIAKKERIDGILSPGTDVAIPTLGAIAEALSLRGPRFEAAQIATDKRAMKRAFVTTGVSTPAFREVRDMGEVMEALETVGCPAILKVVDSSGSRGIERITCRDDVAPAFERCRQATRADSMILEQYIDGEEFGAQAFIESGKLAFVLPHGDTVRTTAAASVPTGHHVPLPVSDALRREIHAQVRLCADALKVDNCALNIDFMKAGGTLYVLEAGARSGATCLAEIVSAHFGFDYYEYMIRFALGQTVEHPFHPGPAVAATLLTADTDGILACTPPAPDDPAVADYMFDHDPGQHVRKFRVGPDRIGHLVVTAPTADEARERVRKITDAIALRIIPDPERPS